MRDLTRSAGGELDVLVQKINAEHQAAERAINESLEHARTCGELLNEAKAAIPHGGWQEWIEANFDGSYRTAAAYMRIAREWSAVAEVQRSASLSLDGALKLLSTPRETTAPATTLPPSARGYDDGGPIDAAAARSFALSDLLTDTLEIERLGYPPPGRALVGLSERRSTVVVITNDRSSETWQGDELYEVRVLQTFGETTVSQYNPNPIPWWLIVDWVHHHTGVFPWGNARWCEVDAPWPPALDGGDNGDE